jgi:hypothetical protein
MFDQVRDEKFPPLPCVQTAEEARSILGRAGLPAAALEKIQPPSGYMTKERWNQHISQVVGEASAPGLTDKLVAPSFVAKENPRTLTLWVKEDVGWRDAGTAVSSKYFTYLMSKNLDDLIYDFVKETPLYLTSSPIGVHEISTTGGKRLWYGDACSVLSLSE